MLVTRYFEPTIENAPCPPFFVENVYDIFISTAEDGGLNATITEAVWDKCVEQFPLLTSTTTTLTTTPTTTTTTEQTTTSTTPTTTEETTTSTTTTTTDQTTTSTTPSTATEQTTTSTTPTTITEQTTTSTTPSTATEQTATSTATSTATEQTTTSTTPTTVTGQKITSTIPSTSTEQTTTSTTTSTATEQTTTSTTPTTITEQTTTSPTPSTVTEQTTTSTTPSTVTEQTTTSTTPTTVTEQTITSATTSTVTEQTTTPITTTEQTTTPTTPSSVTEQTTTSTTSFTVTEQTTTFTTSTTVTEQTTSSTTPSTVTEQTTTSTLSTKTIQEQTSTHELTSISEIPTTVIRTPTQNGKTNSTATPSSTTNTKPDQQTSRSSTPLTFSVTTEFKKISTDITTGQASMTICDTSCLVGSVLFCVCIFVGIIVAVKCIERKRRRKHRFKHSALKHMRRSDKYVPRFSNINRHAHLKSAPLAFVNPTFIEHNVFSPVPYITKTEQFHRRIPTKERRHRQKTFLDEDLRNGDVFFYQGKDSNFTDAFRTSSPRTKHVDSYKRSRQIHDYLPSTINNHVPKVMMPEENEYSLGIIKFYSNSGLPKIDIDYNENDIEYPDYPGSNGQQSNAPDKEKSSLDVGLVTAKYNLDDLQREKNKNSDTADVVKANGFIKEPIRTKENNKGKEVQTDSVYWTKKETKEINSFKKNHGLPRIPFDGTGDNESLNDSTIHHCLPRTAIDASSSFTDAFKVTSNSYFYYSGQSRQEIQNDYNSYGSVS